MAKKTAKTDKYEGPLFGEKPYVDGLRVKWTEKYQSAREAAIAAIRKYDLSESDFWIKMQKGRYGDEIEFTNLIISHSACIKINKKLPKEKQFKPSCVSEGRHPVNGGVALLYTSDEQEIFKTGEANPYNSRCSYLYAMAEKRLFDRVVIALAGLYEEGLYSEVESEAFNERPKMIDDTVPDTETPNRRTALNKQMDPEKAKRLYALKALLERTNSDMDKLYALYRVGDLSELTPDQLDDCEEKVRTKLHRQQQAAKEKTAPQPTAPPAKPEPEVEFLPQEEDLSPLAKKVIRNARGNYANGKAPTVPERKTPAKTEDAVPVQKPEDANLDIEEPTETFVSGKTIFRWKGDMPTAYKKFEGKTLDQIGFKVLNDFFGKKSSSRRKKVDAALLTVIDLWLLQNKPLPIKDEESPAEE